MSNYGKAFNILIQRGIIPESCNSDVSWDCADGDAEAHPVIPIEQWCLRCLVIRYGSDRARRAVERDRSFETARARRRP